MKRHWLITSFTPFAGRTENNSQFVLSKFLEIAKGKNWDFEFHSAVLPTEYDQCYKTLELEIDRLSNQGIKIEGVLSIGEASHQFKIETKANNWDNAPETADNKNIIRSGQKIYPELDEKISFHFPFNQFLKPFAREFLGIICSDDPGNFVCNNLCALATVELKKKLGDQRPFFGFAHVPRRDIQAFLSPEKCAQTLINCFEGL